MNMTLSIRRLTTLTLALLAVGLIVPVHAQPKKVLVVTVTKGFRHSSIPTAERVLGEIARKSGAFTVEYARNDADLGLKMTTANLETWDGIVFANTTGDLPLPDKQAFLDWIKAGNGFIGMHSATDTFRGHTPLNPFTLMIGGEFKMHPPGLQDVLCIVEDPKHPACRHLAKFWAIKDEIYVLNGFERGNVHGLLSLDKHPGDGTPGDFPIAWCKDYGKGRVFYTSLGHAEQVWEDPVYQQHILGGIKWALGLEDGDATPQRYEFKPGAEEAREGFRPLFNGVDLKGWKLRNPGGNASWSAQKGMLINESPKGKPGVDLVSEQAFRDFVLRYEYMIPKGANSGVYLRGRHEIQILDDHGSGQATMQGNGAFYNLAAPAKFVSRPPGAWQTVEATIKGNRASVILNGEKIHDNVLLDRATGNELDARLDQPGPILLQGDHGAVAFRNMRIKELK